MIKFKIDNGFQPISKTKYSAGYDVCSSVDIDVTSTTKFNTIKDKINTLLNREIFKIHNGVTIVPTGVYLDIDNISDYENFWFSLHIRSSLGAKGLFLTNSVGVIDIDYKGEIMLLLSTINSKKFSIKRGDRIGQLILNAHYSEEIDSSREDVSRDGGFGSTNV